jgi:hypothetical protein
MAVAAAILIAALAAPGAFAEEAENLVHNGDFSELADGKPVGWAALGDQSVDQRLEIASDNGNPFAKLTCTRCEKGSGASHAMLAQVGRVRLEKGRLYELRGRARGEGMRGRAVSVAISDTDGWHECGLQTDLRLTAEWQPFRRVFRATRSVDKSSRLQFWFIEPGTFCLDDVRIAEISEGDVVFTDVLANALATNLVPNGSFELGAAGWSSIGRGAGWGNLAHLHGRIETSGGTHGSSFLRIPLGGDDTPVLYFDYLRPVVRRELRPLAVSLHWIPVEKGTTYTLSCDMRASTEGVTAILGVRAKDPQDGPWQGSGASPQTKVRLSTSWRRYSFTFRSQRRYAYVTVGPELDREARVLVDIDAIQLEKGAAATAFQARWPVELVVEPTQPDGLFVEGERAALRVRVFNDSPSSAVRDVLISCKDFFDRDCGRTQLGLSVPGHSSEEKLIDLPSPSSRSGLSVESGLRGEVAARRYYRVSVSDILGDRSFPVAIVPRRASDDSALGINHAFAGSYMIRQAKKAGVAWYRDWSLKWQDLEPAPGQWRWTVSDPQIDRVVGEGVHLMALLPPFGSANWNSEAPAELPTRGYPGERLREAWGPKEPEALGRFTEKVVARYKDRMNVWEFLNEPLYTDYALPGEKYGKTYSGRLYKPEDYVRLLKVAAAGMKRADSACRVMGGIGSHPAHLTKEIIEAGALEHLDILNLHMYPGSRLPESFLPEMDSLLALMDAHGGRKPIWITEFSYYGADDLPRRPFIPSSNDWSEGRLLDSERECANLTVRYMAVMLARGVEKVFIHAGSNGTANEAQFDCCLFGYGATPRKTLPAVAAFTQLIGAQSKRVAEKIIDDRIYCFAFETGDRAVLVAWATDSKPACTVVPPAGATEVLNIVGEPIQAQSVALTESPLYIVGRSGTAKDMLENLRLEVGK